MRKDQQAGGLARTLARALGHDVEEVHWFNYWNGRLLCHQCPASAELSTTPVNVTGPLVVTQCERAMYDIVEPDDSTWFPGTRKYGNWPGCSFRAKQLPLIHLVPIASMQEDRLQLVHQDTGDQDEFQAS